MRILSWRALIDTDPFWRRTECGRGGVCVWPLWWNGRLWRRRVFLLGFFIELFLKTREVFHIERLVIDVCAPVEAWHRRWGRGGGRRRRCRYQRRKRIVKIGVAKSFRGRNRTDDRNVGDGVGGCNQGSGVRFGNRWLGYGWCYIRGVIRKRSRNRSWSKITQWVDLMSDLESVSYLDE